MRDLGTGAICFNILSIKKVTIPEVPMKTCFLSKKTKTDLERIWSGSTMMFLYTCSFTKIRDKDLKNLLPNDHWKPREDKIHATTKNSICDGEDSSLPGPSKGCQLNSKGW